MIISKMALLLLIGVATSADVVAQDCRFKYSADAKNCPTSGSTLLDDTYPVSTYVISIAPYNPSSNAKKVPSEFIMKVLESHNFSENAPNIVVPASAQDFKELKKKLEEKIKASKGKIPASVLTKILPMGTESYTWQQDYFESFVDPSTGRPEVRKIESYGRGDQKAVEHLTKSTASCNISEGDILQTEHNYLKDDGKSFGNGEMGGNIEGLPGGFCLVGDNLSTKFAGQFCGKEENILQIDVSWLGVGHVDEVFKVIPTNIPGVPKECNFSLMFASPKKAIELLSEPRSANHPLFSGDFLKSATSNKDLNEFRNSRSLRKVGKQFCQILNKFSVPARKNKSGPGKTHGASQAFYFIEKQILETAHAEEEPSGPCEVETITNSEFLTAMKDPEFNDYNQLVQKAMDESKKKITDKILSRLPQCRKHLSVMDVPNLFYGTTTVDENGKKELPLPGDGGSFMPNPTNAVVANKSIIFSDPQSPLFRDYLTQELKRKNVGTSFIDTWDYSHLGDGNLHCSSHSIPYCTPVKKGSK